MLSRLFVPATVLLFAVGCSATLSGAVVDGITGAPVSSDADTEGGDKLRLIAEAVTEKPDGGFENNVGAGLTCMTFSSELGADGTYSLSGLCLSATGYRLRLSDNSWFLGETDFLPMGSDASQPRTIKAWHAPMGTGIKTLVAGKHGRVTSRVNLKSETIKGTDSEKVLYPEGLPGGVPLIPAGGSLVITGTANKDMKLVPMINSGRREFKIEAGMESGPTMDAWSYLGTRFTDDTTFERVQAQIDESKVSIVEHRGHFAKFVPAEAVSPPGRYALHVEGQSHAFIVDFGQAGANPGAEPAAAE
jgi:hypothetical protein